MSVEKLINELTAPADTQVSQAGCAHTTFAEAASHCIANAPSPEDPQNSEQHDVDPDDSYLAHVVYQADIRDLTDHDLVDCLRGSANASCFGLSSPESIEERVALIALLLARGFPAKAISGIIIVGQEEGRRQAQRRAAKQMAAEAAAASIGTGHSGTNQYGA